MVQWNIKLVLITVFLLVFYNKMLFSIDFYRKQSKMDDFFKIGAIVKMVRFNSLSMQNA